MPVTSACACLWLLSIPAAKPVALGLMQRKVLPTAPLLLLRTLLSVQQAAVAKALEEKLATIY